MHISDVVKDLEIDNKNWSLQRHVYTKTNRKGKFKYFIIRKLHENKSKFVPTKVNNSTRNIKINSE